MKTKKLMKSSVLKYALLSALGMFLFCPSLRAQNVTISPKTGKLIAASSTNDEVGFERGFSSMWLHNQLPLAFTTADESTLTSSGLLSVHANNIIEADANCLDIIGTTNAYFTLSLPRGYRFTGYKMVLVDKYPTTAFHGWKGLKRDGWTFSEQDKTFTNNYGTGTTISIPSGDTPTNQEYTISRTSTGMNNILYFHLKGGEKGYPAALYVKSIEITFECDNAFTTSVAPTAASSTGVSVVESPFNTGKADIGSITPVDRDSKTYFGYDYNNVKDLSASNLLYEEDAAPNGVADATKGTKTISSVKYGDNYYYGLKNNTYYVETPVSTTAQGDVSIPLGYRITGAKINYALGSYTKAGNLTTDGFYIEDGDYFLNTSGTFTKNVTTANAAV
jgi:hypothetical protein